MPDHMPTPYKMVGPSDNTFIATVTGEGPYGGFICSMGARSHDKPDQRALTEATATFIVRACNCHDELLAACRAAAGIGLPMEHPDHISLHDSIRLRDTAIAHAEEGVSAATIKEGHSE